VAGVGHFLRPAAIDTNIGQGTDLAIRRLAALVGETSPRYTSHSEPSLNGEGMSSLKEFQCEICGIVSENPIHWFVIECGDQKLAVIKWDLTAATSPTARHFCGEAHAQVYISRWFESVCSPPKRVLKAL
jgi:hypothetical protein